MSESKATGRRFVRVKRNQHLHWPVGYLQDGHHYRGGEGYVVDLNAPFESEWMEGQAFKVETVTDNEECEASEITNPTAIAKLRERAKSMKQKRATLTPQEALIKGEREARESQAQADAPEPPDLDPVPAPDDPVKRGPGRPKGSKNRPKPAQEQSDAR